MARLRRPPHAAVVYSHGKATRICAISGPWLVKSVWEHASIGLDEDSVIPEADRGRLLAEMDARRDMLGGACLAEAFIDGREFNLSLLAGGRDPGCGINGCDGPPLATGTDRRCFLRRRSVSTLIRREKSASSAIAPSGRRALSNSATRRVHSRFRKRTHRCSCRLKELALRCWKLFDLQGYARVDFRVDKEGRPWILEVNANPCLSPDAGFHAATLQAGLTFPRSSNGSSDRFI